MFTRNRGITLVEAMVLVAILAIIAAMALPAYQNMINSSRVRAAAEAVYAHVHFTRSESIKEDRNLFLAATGAGSTTWCLGISNDSGCNCSANTCQFGPDDAQVHNLDSTDFESITLTTTGAELEFDSRRGTVPGGGNTFTVSGTGGFSAKVITSSMGRVRLCGNVGGYAAC